MIPDKIELEHIKALLAHSEKEVRHRVFGNTTIVTVKLPNGYTIVESSGCVNPENYDEKIGEENCMKRIEDRLWALEGYCLAEQRSLGTPA